MIPQSETSAIPKPLWDKNLGVGEKFPLASLGAQNADAFFALRSCIAEAFFQQVIRAAVPFHGTGDPQAVDVQPAVRCNGHPCVFCRDVLDKALAALNTAVENKSLSKALLEPFFFCKALLAGHRAADMLLVDVLFGDLDVVHRWPPYRKGAAWPSLRVTLRLERLVK